MKKLLIILFAVTLSGTVCAQKVAIKNNFLYDLSLTPNLGFEFRLGDATTLDISGGWNPFTFGDCKKWKHWMVQPELRIWTCESFNGSFFGIHAHGGIYNFSSMEMPFGLVKPLRDHRFEGYFYGGGLTYGHQWILGPHWNLEAAIGVGYARIYYEKFQCTDCSPILEKGYENYFGPTKASISFMYLF